MVASDRDREATIAAGDPVEDRTAMGHPTRDPLQGSAVTVRPLAPADDLDALYAASHGDPETEALWAWMPYGPFADRDAMGEWLENCATSTDPAFRAVIHRASGRPVGMVSYLNIEPDHRRLELGHIWYAPSVQRTRANTEAIRLLLGEAFDHLGCRRVEWKCNALNTRSRAAALRLGFRFEGIFRQHMIVKGRNRDTAWFALVDRDWPAARDHMERWLAADGSGLSLTALNRSLVEGFYDPATS